MAPSSKLLATSYMERLLGLEPAVFGTKRRKRREKGTKEKTLSKEEQEKKQTKTHFSELSQSRKLVAVVFFSMKKRENVPLKKKRPKTTMRKWMGVSSFFSKDCYSSYFEFTIFTQLIEKAFFTYSLSNSLRSFERRICHVESFLQKSGTYL